MDKAKESYRTGKDRIITAEVAKKIHAYSVSYKDKKFICTICGEYVTFVRGEINVPYFKHNMQNEKTISCELRSKIEQNSTIYEKVGLKHWGRSFYSTKGNVPACPLKSGAGAAEWAGKKPNILNVAVTRAKYRIAIIGDSHLWSKVPNFDFAHKTLYKR